MSTDESGTKLGARRSTARAEAAPAYRARREEIIAAAGHAFLAKGYRATSFRDIADTVIKTQNGTPLHISDIATVAQGPKIRLGQFGRAIRREDGKIIDNEDVVSGIVLMRKGADSDTTLKGIHAKVDELNNFILPSGVKIISSTNSHLPPVVLPDGSNSSSFTDCR